MIPNNFLESSHNGQLKLFKSFFQSFPLMATDEFAILKLFLTQSWQAAIDGCKLILPSDSPRIWTINLISCAKLGKDWEEVSFACADYYNPQPIPISIMMAVLDLYCIDGDYKKCVQVCEEFLASLDSLFYVKMHQPEGADTAKFYFRLIDIYIVRALAVGLGEFEQAKEFLQYNQELSKEESNEIKTRLEDCLVLRDTKTELDTTGLPDPPPITVTDIVKNINAAFTKLPKNNDPVQKKDVVVKVAKGFGVLLIILMTFYGSRIDLKGFLSRMLKKLMHTIKMALHL